MRMLMGLLAGRPFGTTLIGDESLSRRPMRRVIEPLTRMGGRIDAQIRLKHVVETVEVDRRPPSELRERRLTRGFRLRRVRTCDGRPACDR